jgi:hypothetical protein
MRTKLIVTLGLMAGTWLPLPKTNSSVATHRLGGNGNPATSGVSGQQCPKIDSERRQEFQCVCQLPTECSSGARVFINSRRCFLRIGD